jgi:hypothetical protein
MTDVFKTAFRAILTTLEGIDDDIVAATFTPASGDPVSLERVHFKRESFESPDNFNFKAVQTEKTVEVLLEDLGQKPDIGDKITIATVEYDIEQAFLSDGRAVKMVIRYWRHNLK